MNIPKPDVAQCIAFVSLIVMVGSLHAQPLKPVQDVDDVGAAHGGREAADIPMRRRPQDQRPPQRRQGEPSAQFPKGYRSITGYGNNKRHPEWGSAEQPFLRIVHPAYTDFSGSPSGVDRPSARLVSNAVCAQSQSILNARGASDFLWQWGQFLDHDIDETPASNPAEAFDVAVPSGDPWFDPQNTGTQTIPLNRSHGELHDGVRQQVNAITAFIDASNVYGSTEERAKALRMNDGTGRLKITVSPVGDLLPYNTEGLDNAGGTGGNLFLAGDVRANEQIGLLAMHTLFVREHNHWAAEYAQINPNATDEDIYQYARMIVSAEMQAITYREFLPVLIGRDTIPRYRGYNSRVNPGISNIFATASYRLGHSLLSPTLIRTEADGAEAPEGHIALADAFFRPNEIEDNGIESILRGLAAQRCQELDRHLVDEVRNFLFGPPGSGGFDLASLNIQRGRDHGLPGFASACRQLGLKVPERFRHINRDREVWEALEEGYQDVDQIDIWVGGLCEPHVRGAMVGPMLQKVIGDQFTRLRDGDRFYYRNHLPDDLVRLVEKQTLSVIIRRNTDIGDELSDNVFLVAREDDRGRSPKPQSSFRNSKRP